MKSLMFVVVGIFIGLVIGINVTDAKYRDRLTSYIKRVNYLQDTMDAKTHTNNKYVFYYKDNTLYWVNNGVINEDLNWIKPKNIAMDKITKIIYAPDNRLEIFTSQQTWILYYGGSTENDWYVSGPFPVGGG